MFHTALRRLTAPAGVPAGTSTDGPARENAGRSARRSLLSRSRRQALRGMRDASLRSLAALAIVVSSLPLSVLVPPGAPGAPKDAEAAVINVSCTDTTPTDGVCDGTPIQDAITAAAAGDTINLPAGTYTESLTIGKNLTISGAGAATTIIQAAGTQAAATTRVVDVTSGTVSLSGVTIRNGNPVSGPGGGINNAGILTLNNTVITGNTVGSGNNGGGINNTGTGTLHITNSTISANTTTLNGGGINSTGTLSVTNSTISGNTASSNGGGINSTGGTQKIEASTLSGNTATNGLGGGIYGQGTLTLLNTTIGNNAAPLSGGGGVYNGNAGTVEARNVTFSGNTSASGSGVNGVAFHTSSSGLANFKHTIFSGTGNQCGGGSNSTNTVSLGYNISQDGTCNLTQAGDKPSTNSLINTTLANNGGPTMTHALLAGSPAIDAGDSTNGCQDAQATPALLTTDQRGSTRPADGGKDPAPVCDIGAYELQAPFAAAPPSGMTAWWPGDNHPNDLVGANHGALAGGATYNAGVVGQAFSFNGSGQYVSVPDSGALTIGTNLFTIDAWAKVNSFTNQQTVLAHDEGPGTTNKWIFYAGSANLVLHIESATSGGAAIVRSPWTPALNRWYHLAVVRESATGYKFYVDGASLGTPITGEGVALPAAIPNPNAALRIGGAPETGFDTNGLLDEVEFFNGTALTAAQIQGIYNAGAAGKQKPAGGGSIIVKKTTPSPTSTLFDFDFHAPATSTEFFTLDTDPNTSNYQDQFVRSGLAAGGPYNVFEVVPTGWQLDSITCDPAGGAAVNLATPDVDITLAANQVVSCTFTNTQAAGPADDYGNNAATAHLVAVPSDTNGNLEVLGDVDFFKFTATAGTLYNINTTLGTLTDSTLTLFDASGNQLAFNDDCIGLASCITFGATASGTHYVKVAGYIDQRTGTYTLHIGQPPVSGRVTDEADTTGIAGASVSIEPASGAGINTTTNAQGFYSFTSPLADGTYDIWVLKDGFTATSIRTFTLTGGGLGFSGSGTPSSSPPVFKVRSPAPAPQKDAPARTQSVESGEVAFARLQVAAPVTLPSVAMKANNAEVTGTILRASNNAPLPGAYALVYQQGMAGHFYGMLFITNAIKAGSDGVYHMPVASGTYSYIKATYEAENFFLQSDNYTVATGVNTKNWLLGPPATTQSGPDFIVTRGDDPTPDACNTDDCSLREAVIAANTNAVPSTITFAAGVNTVTLTRAGFGEDLAATGDLDVTTGSLTINGGLGSDTVTIRACPTDQKSAVCTTGMGVEDRVFDVLATATLNLVNITVANGRTPTGFIHGGGIQNNGTLSLTRSTVRDNRAARDGGGIDSRLGAGVVTLDSSTIQGNEAGAEGVGLGGGIYVTGGSLTVTNSSISGNRSPNRGAGILNGNLGSTTIVSSTITANIGDGISADSNGTSVVLGNSILSGNVALNTTTPRDCVGDGGGTLTSQGYNLIGKISGHVDGQIGCTVAGDTTGNVMSEIPILGPLANNGGPTMTHALLQGSPAVDAGNPAAPSATPPACPTTDQRGVARPQATGQACDIGAYEAIKINISDAAPVSEGNSGTTPATFDISLSADPPLGSGPVTVRRSTADGSATVANGDYIPVELVSLTLTSTTPVQVTVPIRGDTAPEDNETFFLNLSDAVNAVIADGQGMATITNDDTGSVNPQSGSPSFVVTRNDDPAPDGCNVNDCSLREAVIAANGNVDPSTITFAAGVNTITLTRAGSGEDAAATGDLDISQPLTINGGTGNDTVTVQACAIVSPATTCTGIDRVFQVLAGANVTLSGLTIRNGSADNGGGIRNDGTLAVNHSTISGNSATNQSGGGIHSNSSTLTVTDSTISGNSASNGGGIFGGGTVTNSTISGNSAPGGFGGGIYASVMTITNSTIAGNSAPAGFGGGIFTGGLLTLRSSTISGNSAATAGGISNNVGTVTITNTIVAKQTSGADCSGSAVTSQGYNLESGTSCGFTGTNDQQSVSDLNLALGALASNGGPTQTMALLAGSPAVNAGNPGVPGSGGNACPATDQRGVARTGVCDIGAFEVQTFAVRPMPSPTPFPGNDDGSTGLVPIGFPVNFFGAPYSQLYVNNNGNVTFDSPLSTYTPFGLTGTNRVIIAPFFGDVDTRAGNLTTYGTGTVDYGGAAGVRPAFAVTWPEVGCYSFITSVLNKFQVILIDRSDIASGNFDIEFNYDKIQWETGQASGGSTSCQGGAAARVGFSNGAGAAIELPGSGVVGGLLDSNPTTGLVHHSRGSAQPGRYVFEVRGAGLVGVPVINNINPNGRAIADGVVTVTLSGANFQEGVTVASTDTNVATVVTANRVDANTITVPVTPLATGVTRFRVDNPDGFSAFSPVFTVNPGTITVHKVTAPASHPQHFSFQAAGVEPNVIPFTLDTQAGSDPPNERSFTVPGGAYVTVTEVDIPAGWLLANISCTGGAFGFSSGADDPGDSKTKRPRKALPRQPFFSPGITSASGTVNTGDNILCTFTNEAATVSINNAMVIEGDSGTKDMVFTVSLSTPSSSPVTVDFATMDGTASAAGADYVSNSGTVTFAPGETTKSIVVVVNGDTVNEIDETFFVNLSNASGAGIAAGMGRGTGTILNDDGGGLPSLSISDVLVKEGDTGGGVSAVFTVTLTPLTNETVTVNFSTENGTAEAGSDYTAVPSTVLTFGPNTTTQTITVLVTPDTAVEANETFFVNLSGPSNNARIARGTGQGVILNDDGGGTPTLFIDNVLLAEGNSGSAMAATFTVVLTPANATQTVTVDFTTLDGTATAGTGDYTAGAGTLTFASGETVKNISVVLGPDSMSEADEVFFVRLSNATNATIGDPEGFATIIDDDALPSLSISSAGVFEGNSGTTVSAPFTVNLSAPSGQTVVVTFATADGTTNGATVADNDYVSNAGTLVFMPGETAKTVSVTVNGDNAVEPDETFFVNLTSATNAAISVGQGPGAIINDDAAGTGTVIFVSPSGDDTTGTGAEGSPVRTIGKALTLVQPGGTVDVAAGAYPEKDLMVTQQGVHIKGPGTGPNISRAVITGTNCSSTPQAVVHLHANGVRFTGLEVVGDPTTCPYVVHMGGATGDIQVSGVIVAGNVIRGGAYGVTISWGSNNNIVDHNEIRNNSQAGVLLDSASNNLVKDNRILINTVAGVILDECLQVVNCGVGAPGGNVIAGNALQDNGRGVHLRKGLGNTFHRNYFLGNVTAEAVDDSGAANGWHGGAPDRGNFWANYQTQTGVPPVDADINGCLDTNYPVKNGSNAQVATDTCPLPGLNIHVLSGGDSTSDNAVVQSLQNRGHTVTLGVEAEAFNGAQDLSTTDVVVFLNGYNWTDGSMPASGQVALLNYVQGGGGLATIEWLIWNIDAAGKNPGLAPLMPVHGGPYNSAVATTYTQATPDTVLNDQLPASFEFPLTNIAGSESIFTAKAGATTFYSSSNAGGAPGVAGWTYGSGRVISFSTLSTQVELSGADSDRLLANAMEWARRRPATGPSLRVTDLSNNTILSSAAGGTVRLVGTGFTPGAQGMLHLNGVSMVGAGCDPSGVHLASFTATGGGFTIPVTIPAECAGVVPVLALVNDATVARSHLNVTSTSVGSLSIVKVTNPAVSQQAFTFTTSNLTPGSFTLDTNPATNEQNSRSFTDLASGVTYIVTEMTTDGGGWTLTDIGCTGAATPPVFGATGAGSKGPRKTGRGFAPGQTSVSITLGAGENVVCTFTNTQAGGGAANSITIVKEVAPGTSDQTFPFAFTTSAPATTPFTLDDDGNNGNTYSNTRVFGDLAASTYQVSETSDPTSNLPPVLPAGWRLTNINCIVTGAGGTIVRYEGAAADTTFQPGDHFVIVELKSGDSVFCTFTNTKPGSITIVEDVTTGTDPQDFGFSTTLGAFTLDDDGSTPGSEATPDKPVQKVFTGLPLGSYTFTQTLVDNWALSDIVCTGDTDNGSVKNLASREVVVDLDGGEDITCTFRNQPAGSGAITITKQTYQAGSPISDAQPFGFTATGGLSPSSFTLDTDFTETHPSFQAFSSLVPGSYTVTETVASGWRLVNIVCSGATNSQVTVGPAGGFNAGDTSVAITLAAGEQVSCTFQNSKGAVGLTPIATNFNGMIGIDHHQPTNQVVVSVNYSSGEPHNFELVAGDGSRSRFSAVHGLTDEVKIATVRPSACQQGFVTGELFVGTGVPGHIARISPDGSSIVNPWVALPGETGLMRGSLFVDRHCVFGGDLIAVTTAGGVWRITSAGAATKLAQLDTHLEGVTTVPVDVAKYGPWSGKILAGAEEEGRIWAIPSGGSGVLDRTNTPYFELGINPEDFDVIPAGENFFGVDFGSQTLWGAPASHFSGMVGDLLIAQEFPGYLWHVRWDPAATAGPLHTGGAPAPGDFVVTLLAQVAQWEHVTFSTAGIRELPPTQPSLFVNPKAGPRGSTPTLGGGGLSPNSSFMVHLDGTGMGSDTGAGNPCPTTGTHLSGASSDANGNLVPATVTIPLCASDGVHTLQLVGTSGTVVASTTFRVFTPGITIRKEVQPGTSPANFAFEISSNGGTSFTLFATLDDDNDPGLPSAHSAALAAGSYIVREVAQASWQLVDISCAAFGPDGSSFLINGDAIFQPGDSAVAITLVSGGNVTCVFTNTQEALASITIVKDVVSAAQGSAAINPQDFPFRLTGPIVAGSTTPAPQQSFLLDDDGSEAEVAGPPSSRSFLGLAAGVYEVREEVLALPPGWVVTDIDCVTASGLSSFDPRRVRVLITLAEGDSMRCTFKDELQAGTGTLTVRKDVESGTSPQVFGFQLIKQGSAGTPEGFSLDDDGSDTPLPSQKSFPSLPVGRYVVHEALPLPQGWATSNAFCFITTVGSGSSFAAILGPNSTSPAFEPGDHEAVIDLRAGDTVACTFVNSAPQVFYRLAPSSSLVGSGQTVQVAIVMDSGPQPVDGAEVVLSFDPAKLEVVDSNTTLSGIQINATGGCAFPAAYTVTNTADNINGRIHLARGVNPSAPAPQTGTCTLGVVTFRAKTVTVAMDSALTFVLPDAFPASKASYLGEPLRVTVENGVVRVVPDHLRFASQPVRGSAGVVLGLDPVVEVFRGDTFRAGIDNLTSVTLSVRSRSGAPGAGFSCASGLTLTVVNSRAIFVDCKIDLRGDDYVLVATATDVGTGASSSFDIGHPGNATPEDCGVDIVDFSRLVRGFGFNHISPAFDPLTDFNGDNVTDIEDFSVLVTYFSTRCVAMTFSEVVTAIPALQLQGTGYLPFTPVSLTLDGSPVVPAAGEPGLVVTDGSGNFTTRIARPTGAPSFVIKGIQATPRGGTLVAGGVYTPGGV